MNNNKVTSNYDNNTQQTFNNKSLHNHNQPRVTPDHHIDVTDGPAIRTRGQVVGHIQQAGQPVVSQ